jgi:nicotinate-nucleotide pyrophosphorylase
MGLYDEILIKDNHIVAFSKLYKDISKDIITHIISITKKRKLKNVRIEIEVTNLHQLGEKQGKTRDTSHIFIDINPSQC